MLKAHHVQGLTAVYMAFGWCGGRAALFLSLLSVLLDWCLFRWLLAFPIKDLGFRKSKADHALFSLLLSQT